MPVQCKMRKSDAVAAREVEEWVSTMMRDGGYLKGVYVTTSTLPPVTTPASFDLVSVDGGQLRVAIAQSMRALRADARVRDLFAPARCASALTPSKGVRWSDDDRDRFDRLAPFFLDSKGHGAPAQLADAWNALFPDARALTRVSARDAALRMWRHRVRVPPGDPSLLERLEEVDPRLLP